MLQHKHLYSIKSSLKFVYSRKQLQYLYLIPQVLHFLLSCPNSHLIPWIPSESLLTRFDKEIAINLALSVKDIFFVYFVYCIFFSSPFLSILVTSFSIGTVNVISFSVFSPKQVNCYLSSSANSFMNRNFFRHIIF